MLVVWTFVRTFSYNADQKSNFIIALSSGHNLTRITNVTRTQHITRAWTLKAAICVFTEGIWTEFARIVFQTFVNIVTYFRKHSPSNEKYPSSQTQMNDPSVSTHSELPEHVFNSVCAHSSMSKFLWLNLQSLWRLTCKKLIAGRKVNVTVSISAYSARFVSASSSADFFNLSLKFICMKEYKFFIGFFMRFFE